MRTITAIVLSLMLCGCSVTPMLIPDTTKGSAMTRKIDNDTEMNKPLETGYGWILWYIPFAGLAMAWGYREFIRKPLVEAEPTRPTRSKTKRRK
jgi:hypothetical protein